MITESVKKRCQYKYKTKGKSSAEVMSVALDAARREDWSDYTVFVQQLQPPWYSFSRLIPFEVEVVFKVESTVDAKRGPPSENDFLSAALGSYDAGKRKAAVKRPEATLKCDDCLKEITMHDALVGHNRLEAAGYVTRDREGNVPPLFPQRCSRCTSERLERPKNQWEIIPPDSVREVQGTPPVAGPVSE